MVGDTGNWSVEMGHYFMGSEALALGRWGTGVTRFALVCLPSALPPALCQPWPLPDRPLGEIFSHALITSCLDRVLSCGNQAGTEA